MDEDTGFSPPGEEQHNEERGFANRPPELAPGEGLDGFDAGADRAGYAALTPKAPFPEFGIPDSAWDGSLPEGGQTSAPPSAASAGPEPDDDARCDAPEGAGEPDGDARDDAPCEIPEGTPEPGDDGPDHAAGVEEPAARLLGIRLRKAGQVYFVADSEHTVRVGTKVVVELEQGPSLGEVVSVFDGGIRTAEGEEGVQVPGRVTGLATAQDIAQHAENSILAAEASAFCKTCIRQRNLDMKLVDVEVLHDRSKIIFFFTAPSRIDFRELVKDLVRNYRTRIELRQIGVRHETQMIGGLGNCGMVCCCHQYLRKFAPVTIKMAKEQNLFLNPAKLSGMCGRLLCCLSFEQGNYEEFNRRCPKLGKKYVTNRGLMKVLRANLFSRSVFVLSETGEELELPLEEWDSLEPRRAEPQSPDPQRPAVQRGDAGRRNGLRKDDPQRPGDDRPGEGTADDRREGEQRPRHHRPRKRRREP